MKKLALLVGLVLLFLTPAYAQISIVVSIGQPKIESLGYERIGFEDFLVAKIKNTGSHRGTFSYKMESNQCSFYESVRQFTLDAGSREELKLKLSCSIGSATLKFTVEDVNSFFGYGNESDEQTITFNVEKPVYCGTMYGFCTQNQKTCLENKIVLCNQYCDGWITLQTCDNRCSFMEGEPKCISKEDDERSQLYSSIMAWLIFGVPVLFIIGLSYYIYRKHKKRFRKRN
jgi:hypothetical protein